jgi:Domain of unknown function (DUF6458)
MPLVSENRGMGQPNDMGIGIGIFLIALGAILTFAVDWSIAGLDLHVVGWILMVVGVGGLIMFSYFWNRSRVPEAVAAVRQRQVAPPPRTYDDPTPPPPTTLTTVRPQSPPATVTPQPPFPAQVTTVSATAPVAASSKDRREGSRAPASRTSPR